MDTGRVVVITGASGGVGSALVGHFLGNGDQVIATDMDAKALDSLRAGQEVASELVIEAADISVEADCARLAEATKQHAGRVDVLINCAGYFPFCRFEDMTSDQWRRVIDINLTGMFLMTRAMLPLIKGRGWGRIINFGSASVFDGTAGQSHYVAAKAGVIGFSRSLAREVGDYGITVNVITPGVTLTESARSHLPPDLLAAQRAARAIGRDEQPSDLLGAVGFLASPGADFISGQTLNVDGGKFMR